MKKKTLDEQIAEDTRSVRDDIRRIGVDLIATLRRARREAAPGPEAREEATEVREEPMQPGEYPEGRRRASTLLRALALFFGLGTVASVVLMRRHKAHVAEGPEPRRRWRPRLSRRARRTAVEAETPEPAGRGTS
jgi:hypothetical protein